MKIVLLAASVLGLGSSALAEIKTRTVEYSQGDTKLVGFLAYDDAVATPEAPRPGVVVCPEWWGNNEYAHSRARQLAEAGYVAFSIDMYGKGPGGEAKTTDDPKEAGKWAGEVNADQSLLRARAKAGYDTLVSQKMVDHTKMAAIGYCMGGTVAIELARTGVHLDAIVSFHASRLSAKDPADNRNIHGTVLVCQGQDDSFMSDEEKTRFHQQMKEAGVDYEFDSYAGAVHSFTNKAADSHNMPGVKYNEKADHRSWNRMIALFREKFGGERGMR